MNKDIPADEKEEIMLNSLVKSISENDLTKFDPNKGTLIKYIGQLFYKKMISELKKWFKNNENKVPLEYEDEDGEQRDRIPKEETDTSEVVELKDLIGNINDFIDENNKGKKSKRLKFVFSLMLKGFNGKEIAKELKITPQAASLDIKALRDQIVNFAQKSDNDILKNMTKKFLSSDVTSDDVDDGKDILKLLKEYKRKVGFKGTTYEPKGDTQIQIERKKLDSDLTNQRHLADKILEGDSPDELREDLEAFSAIVDEADEVIEEEESLVSLKVLEARVASQNPLAKCILAKIEEPLQEYPLYQEILEEQEFLSRASYNECLRNLVAKGLVRKSSRGYEKVNKG